MINLKRIAINGFLLLVPLLGFADATSHLSFLGFSKDGRYLAFESFSDGNSGSGESSEQVFFVDVPSNTWAHRPVGLKEAESVLKTLQISSHEIGFHAYTRLAGDQSELSTIRVNREEYGSWNAENHADQIALEERLFEKRFGTESKLLKLTLKPYDSSTEIILQDDKTLPESRGRPFHYRFKDVYYYGNSVAVFVEFFVPGYEGHDNHFMAITAQVSKAKR